MAIATPPSTKQTAAPSADTAASWRASGSSEPYIRIQYPTDTSADLHSAESLDLDPIVPEGADCNQPIFGGAGLHQLILAGSDHQWCGGDLVRDRLRLRRRLDQNRVIAPRPRVLVALGLRASTRVGMVWCTCRPHGRFRPIGWQGWHMSGPVSLACRPGTLAGCDACHAVLNSPDTRPSDRQPATCRALRTDVTVRVL
jgi:hypothetical protein